jgi:hypothetical protein
MNTTTQTIELPRELVAADQTARAALDKRRRLDAQTATLPADIERADKALAALCDELRHAEVDAAVAPPAEAAQIQQRADALHGKVEIATKQLAELQRKFEAFEISAPRIDAEVTDVARVFEAELQTYLRALMTAFDQELDDALAPARAVVAKMLPLQSFDLGRNFLNTMCVPLPTLNWQLDSVDLRLVGRNLLAADEPDADMVARLAPLIATRTALRSHQAYVPRAVAEEERRKRIPTSHGYRIESWSSHDYVSR